LLASKRAIRNLRFEISEIKRATLTDRLPSYSARPDPEGVNGSRKRLATGIGLGTS
jgi:hypothetical protein